MELQKPFVMQVAWKGARKPCGPSPKAARRLMPETARICGVQAGGLGVRWVSMVSKASLFLVVQCFFQLAGCQQNMSTWLTAAGVGITACPCPRPPRVAGLASDAGEFRGLCPA